MIVRREQPGDVAAVRLVQSAAFAKGPDEPLEARLLDALRIDAGWIDRFSIVAELDGAIVGHNVCTRGYVGKVPALGLGPIAVRPDRQRDGVGLALMHAMVGAADACGEPFIALLGSPKYYARFGFVAAATLGIDAPEPAWGVHFQVRTLSSYDPAVRGTFTYAGPFTTVT